MAIRHTLWDDANRNHILADGSDHPERELFEEDIDEVVTARPHPNVVMDEYEVSGEARMDIVGRTSFDRVLFVVVSPRPVDAVRPVMARDATDAEVAYYLARLRVKR